MCFICHFLLRRVNDKDETRRFPIYMIVHGKVVYCFFYVNKINESLVYVDFPCNRSWEGYASFFEFMNKKDALLRTFPRFSCNFPQFSIVFCNIYIPVFM